MSIKPINPIKIPIANTHMPMARNFVSKMASDGFLPVIALEAFVESGRTYQAYQRGGFDEARERITEEFSGAVFWLGGVTGLNWVFEKIGQKILKLPNIVVDIASDEVRNPLGNYLKDVNVLEKTMAKFKFIKVISSILLANAFIGFCLPKINQAITRSYHKKQDVENAQNNSNQQNQTDKTFFVKPSLQNFVQTKDEKDKNKNVSFGLNLLSIANKFESDRNYKLLSVDAGTASGRAISARNNDERVEILFRDLSSIYFYMFNMVNINTWLNKIEQNGNSTRLDPVSAEFSTKYMEQYLVSKKTDKVSVEEFAKDMLGKQQDIPESLKGKFAGKNIKIISLDAFKEELKNLVPAEDLKYYEDIAQRMSKLQPELRGQAILTAGQVKDILNGGHINNPDFLQEFFKNKFGNKFMDKYAYVAQNELDNYKKELIDYVQKVIDTAKKSNAGEISEKLLRKVSNNNLKMNAINWGTGFAISALFLSTLIPKMQYLITKLRTGSTDFPGTEEYRKKSA